MLEVIMGMKSALVFFSIVTGLSLWFAAQGTAPVVCRGKVLPITLLPGPKMTGPEVPLRFGGTRPMPGPPINIFVADKGFRLVIKNRDEFSDFWKRFTAAIPPPEIDFTKEMIVVSAMGQRPTSGYWTFIDGACEVDGHVEVFVSNVEDPRCIGAMDSLTYPADAVRLPQTNLPVVFRETQISCRQWAKQIGLNP
jgi:hypothetical protein